MAIARVEPINRIRIIKRWGVIGAPGLTMPSVVELQSNILWSKADSHMYFADYTITSTSR